jgi:hypothetical protein
LRSRTRKLIGAASLVVLAVFWPLLTVGLAHSNLASNFWLAQVVFILVFGLIWILPAAWIIRWMQQPDRGAGSR